MPGLSRLDGEGQVEHQCSFNFSRGSIKGQAPRSKCRGNHLLSVHGRLTPVHGGRGAEGMKARPDEAFLCFLPTFSIQLAKSQFQAKYGILPTGAAARAHPGWAASTPSCTFS